MDRRNQSVVAQFPFAVVDAGAEPRRLDSPAMALGPGPQLSRLRILRVHRMGPRLRLDLRAVQHHHVDFAAQPDQFHNTLSFGSSALAMSRIPSGGAAVRARGNVYCGRTRRWAGGFDASTNGAFGWNAAEFIHQPAFLNEKPEDCIGAGDSFNAGFIHKFIQGSALKQCLETGAVTGAVSTTKAGGTGAFGDIYSIRELALKHFSKQI